MPVVLSVHGYQVFFFSNEGSPREPLHVHVRRAGCSAKVWIDPHIATHASQGFNSREIREIEALVVEYTQVIRSRWNEHFGS